MDVKHVSVRFRPALHVSLLYAFLYNFHPFCYSNEFICVPSYRHIKLSPQSIPKIIDDYFV